MIYCENCGYYNDDNSKFCKECGSPLKEISHKQNTSKSSFVNRINDYIGNEKPANLNWKALFSDVLKKHSKEEAEDIFICGTKKTTPSLENVSQSWPRPWLYSRVFLMFAIAFFLIYVCCSIFKNTNTLPGLIGVGAFAIPLSGIVLFLEVNAYRNISLYDIAVIFLVGGCASLVVTLLLFSVIDTGELDFKGALLVGIIEEVGKAVIVYYFIKKINNSNILPGLLIGACIGAGFAAFETAGYILRAFVSRGWDAMMDVMYLRGILSPGGHIAWAAITGAAMSIVAKESGVIDSKIFTNKKFIRLFMIPILLHALWDSPLSMIGIEIYLVPFLLVLVVWIVVLIFINMGLSEISKHKIS